MKAVVIHETGDPGVGDPGIAKKRGGSTMTVLEQWSKALKDRGVTRIKGKLYYFDGAFEGHGSLVSDDFLQGLTVEVLHDEKDDAVFCFSKIGNANCVRMRNS